MKAAGISPEELLLAHLAEIPEPADAPTPPSALAQTQAALAGAGRMRGYRDYLAQARGFKAASGADAAGAIDEQVRDQARQAKTDMHVLMTTMIARVADRSGTGDLVEMTNDWHEGLQQAGAEVSVASLWQRTATSGAARDALISAGLGAADLDEMETTLSNLDARLSVDGDRIRVTGSVGDQPVEAFIPVGPSPQPTQPSDLLTRGRVAHLSQAFAAGEPAYLYGVPARLGAELETAAVSGAFAGYSEMLQHVRKLEDSGLDTHVGSDGGTVLVIVIIVVLASMVAAGAVLHWIYCPKDPNKPKPDLCILGEFLEYLGIFLYVMLSGGKVTVTVPPSNTSLLSTPVIHGTADDIAASVPA